MNLFTWKWSALSVWLLAGRLTADTVWFSGDDGSEVLILEETDSQLTFKQGRAKVTLPKTSLRRFEYGTPEENAEILARWKQKYILDVDQAPDALRELSKQFHALQTKLAAVKSAAEDLDSSQRNSHSAESQCAVLQQKIQRLVEDRTTKFSGLDKAIKECNALSSDINDYSIQWSEVYKYRESGYTEKLERINAAMTALRKSWKQKKEAIQPSIDQRDELSAEITVLQQKYGRLSLDIKTAAKASVASQKAESAYMYGIETFRVALKTEGSEAHRALYPDFFEELDLRFEQMRDDIKTELIEVGENRGSITVDAVLNGMDAVTLIFDTGATSMTLSRAVAERLGLVLDDSTSVSVRLANGLEVKAIPLFLDSVKVGSAEREHVPVLVLDQPPGDGTDGLLGMSFLKHFTIHFNADKKRMELIHL